MKKNKIFFKNYITEFSQVIDFNNQIINQIIKIKTILQKKSKNNKVLIFGNGGSAAISSHVSVDLTKNAGIKCINFNESDLITCFSNDYGYENWIKEGLKFYLNKNDLLILISSSGVSSNMINACREASKHTKNIITFTGFRRNNKLSKMGKINIWIDSKHYNYVENIHQILLLYLSDKMKK